MFSSIVSWICYILKTIIKLLIIILLILIPFDSRHTEITHLLSNGLFIGAFYNCWNYVIEANGRENMLVIYDKSREYGIGVFDWWVRLDRPHWKVDFYHLNVNPRISGVPDPHTFVSYPMAVALQLSGFGLKLLNKAAPFVFVAFLIDDYKTIYDVLEDDRTEGTREAVLVIAKYVFCWYGAKLGANLATIFLPGVGSLLGSLSGGAGSRMAFEIFLSKL